MRGEKDFCVILIIGNDIVKFMRSIETRKYFSEQTRKQIDIGLDISEFAVEQATENAKRNSLSDTVTFRAANVLDESMLR